MKTLAVIAASIMFAAAAYGQGQFYFTNRDLASGVNARFVFYFDTGMISSVGTDYTITLTGGPIGALTGGPIGGVLVPLEPSTATFRGAAGTPLAGYVNPIVVTVPGVAPGGNAEVDIKISSPGGVVYERKFDVNGLGGGTVLPPTIQLGTGAIVIGVPEPGTLALPTLGLGALFALRRRK